MSAGADDRQKAARERFLVEVKAESSWTNGRVGGCALLPDIDLTCMVSQYARYESAQR